MRPREDAAREALAFTNQSQKEVLGLDRDATELTRFVTGEEEYSSGPFGVPFEHPAYLLKTDGVGVTGALITLYGIQPD
jgi:hypothetical protein